MILFQVSVVLAVVGLCACLWMSQFFWSIRNGGRRRTDPAFLALGVYFAATALALGWFCLVMTLGLWFGSFALAQSPWRPLGYLVISDAALLYLIHALRPRRDQ